MYCPTCRNEKCVYISTKKRLVFTTVKSAKPAATFSNFLSRTRNLQFCCLTVMAHIVLQEKRVVTTKNINQLKFWIIFSANHNQAYPNLNQKKQNSFHLWHFCVDSSSVKKNDGNEWSLDFKPDSVILMVKDQRSRPWNDNRFQRKSSDSMVVVVVAQTRLFEQPSSESSSYP